MSNSTGNSAGSSNSRLKRRVHRIPRSCWCGVKTVSLVSKSSANPNRRYYRCSLAASERLTGDEHVFKWFDDGIEDEVLSMVELLDKLQKDVADIRAESVENQKIMAEKVESYGRFVKIACSIVALGSTVVLAKWLV